MRYGTFIKKGNAMKAIIFVCGDIVMKQFEICQNFADFFDYEVIGIATKIDTLFKYDLEYDAVIVTKYDIISNNERDLQEIKTKLLQRDIIIIQAVRT